MPNDSTLSFLLCLHLPPSLWFSVCISLSRSAFCWQCSVRVFNEMPPFEVGWWRCEIDAIKKLMFKAQKNLCMWVQPKPRSCWHQQPEGGAERERVSWTLQLRFEANILCVSSCYVTNSVTPPISKVNSPSKQQAADLQPVCSVCSPSITLVLFAVELAFAHIACFCSWFDLFICTYLHILDGEQPVCHDRGKSPCFKRD